MNEVTKIEPTVQEHQLPADPMVSMIERVAMDPNADIAKLEQMLAMKERMECREAAQQFAAAFASASAEFPSVPLNGKGHNNLKYALLKDIMSCTRPVLSKHGLALTFAIDTSENITVTAKLMHRGGHSETTSIVLPADTSGSKNAVQAVGSSQTYGQRYTAQAILGLSLGDDIEDDGAAAGGNALTAQQYTTLRDLISETDTDEATFHKAFGWKGEGVPELHQFPAVKFDQAVSMLKAKKAKANA